MASAEGDMSLVCRCCLLKESELTNIFKEISDGEPLSYARLIENCIGVEIISGDGLPKYICTKCSSDVLKFHDFKKMCLQSVKILKPAAVVQLELLKNVACQTYEPCEEPKSSISPSKQIQESEEGKLDSQDNSTSNKKLQNGEVSENDETGKEIGIESSENETQTKKSDASVPLENGKKENACNSKEDKKISSTDEIKTSESLADESILKVLNIEKEKDSDVIEAAKELGDAVDKLSSCYSRMSGDLEDWLEGSDGKERGENSGGDTTDNLSNVIIVDTVGNYIESCSSNGIVEGELEEKDDKTESLMKERDGDDAIVMEDVDVAKEKEISEDAAEKNSYETKKSVSSMEGKLIIKSFEELSEQGSKGIEIKEGSTKNGSQVVNAHEMMEQESDLTSDEKANEQNETGILPDLKSFSAANIEVDGTKKRPWVEVDELAAKGESEGPNTKKICLSKTETKVIQDEEIEENMEVSSDPLAIKDTPEDTLQDPDQSKQKNAVSTEIDQGKKESARNNLKDVEPARDFSDDGNCDEEDSEQESSGSEYQLGDSPARSDDSLTFKEAGSRVKTCVKERMNNLRSYKLKECRVILSDIAHPNLNALSAASSISSRVSTPSRVVDVKDTDESRSTSSSTAWIKVEPKDVEEEEEEEETEDNADPLDAAEGGQGNLAKQEAANIDKNPIPDVPNSQGVSAESQRPLAKFVSGRKRFLCPFCAKAFRTKSQMMLHRSLHTGDLPYPCEVCGKRFPLRCRLLRHMSVHDASITCDFCGMDFKTNILLGRHIKARHTIPSYPYAPVNAQPQSLVNKSGQRYPCRLCPKVFSTMNGLKGHKRVHVNTNVKVLPVVAEKLKQEEKSPVSLQDTCKICGMSFPNALYLKSHMVCHNIIRPDSGKLVSIESPKPAEGTGELRAVGNANINAGNSCDESLNLMEPTVLIHESSSSYEEPSFQQQNQPYGKISRFSCSVCSQIFQSRSQMFRHQTLIHRALKCEVCARMFSSAEEVQSHKLVEHPTYNEDMLAKKRHECNVCGRGFPKHCRLVQHMVAVHSNAPKQNGCDECGKHFPSLELLEIHKKIHETKEADSGKESLTCHVCQRVYTKKSRLKRHMLLHESQSYQCHKCPKTFISQGLLNEHLDAHPSEEEQGVSCTACGRVFANRGRLKQHVVVHTKSGFVSCDNCFKVFTNEQVLEMHVQKCKSSDESSSSSQPTTSSKSALTPPTPPSGFASCTSCSKAFPTKSLLTEHEKTCVGLTVVKKMDGTWKVLDNEGRARGAARSDVNPRSELTEEVKCIPCKICHKKFSNYHGLNSHMRFHQGVHKCDLCPKKFSSRNELSQHMSSHPAVYRCGICSETFGMVDELRKHVTECMATQSVIEATYFSCNACSEVFSYQEELAEHVKFHSGEFPHVCPKCYKVFAHTLQLSRHMTTHFKDGENSQKGKHTCNICQRDFATNAALDRHKVVHSGEKRFQCPYCFLWFSQKSSLNRHRLTQHETKS